MKGRRIGLSTGTTLASCSASSEKVNASMKFAQLTSSLGKASNLSFLGENN